MTNVYTVHVYSFEGTNRPNGLMVCMRAVHITSCHTKGQPIFFVIINTEVKLMAFLIINFRLYFAC